MHSDLSCLHTYVRRPKKPGEQDGTAGSALGIFRHRHSASGIYLWYGRDRIIVAYVRLPSCLAGRAARQCDSALTTTVDRSIGTGLLQVAVSLVTQEQKQDSAHPSHYRQQRNAPERTFTYLSAEAGHHDHAPPFHRWGSKSPPRLNPPPSTSVERQLLSLRAIINGGPPLCCSQVLRG